MSDQKRGGPADNLSGRTSESVIDTAGLRVTPAGDGIPSGADHTGFVDESVRAVITAAETARVPDGGMLLLRAGARITPLAADEIAARQIRVRFRTDRSNESIRPIVAIGSDHSGFEVKPKVVELLIQSGFQCRDFGVHSADPVDYPEIAHAVARAVADGQCDFGIILDGAGIGSCMAANKVPGIRAALCYNEASAKNSREHNFANVLTLGARMQTLPVILSIVTTWLATPTGEDRHRRRVARIMALEKQYFR